MIQQKIRSEKNRTITLNVNDIDSLYKNLLKAEDIPNKPFTYLLNKTIYADLFDVINHLPNEFADLIIIDPPYNLDKNFNGYQFKSLKDKDYDQYLQSWFSNVIKCLKPNGSLYLCGDWKCSAALYNVMNEYLHIVNRITWQREKGRGAKMNWKNAMEDIWFGVKNPKEYYFDVDSVMIKRKVLAPYKMNGKPKDWEETKQGNFRTTHPSNFWDDITVPYWSMPENTDHPTQKPEKLIAKLILASSKKGDIVFDPFLGSGTTSVVAKKLGRNYIGIEMNKEYAMYAEKRLALAENDHSIQGYTDGTFWERNTLNIQKRTK